MKGIDAKRFDREWQAQECAMDEERRSDQNPNPDATVNQYRLITQSLCQPPMAPIPNGFSKRVAALAELPEIAGEKAEQLLLFCSLALLAAAGIGSGILVLSQSSMPVSQLADLVSHPITSWGSFVLGLLIISERIAHRHFWRCSDR